MDFSMDCGWIDYQWVIHGSLRIIHGHPWISMDFQGLGGMVGHVGRTGQHIPGETFGKARQVAMTPDGVVAQEFIALQLKLRNTLLISLLHLCCAPGDLSASIRAS